MYIVYLDVETVPTQNEGLIDQVIESVKPPRNLKKDSTIAKWYAEDRPKAIEDKLNNLQFDPLYAEIVCISAAIDKYSRGGVVSDKPMKLMSWVISPELKGGEAGLLRNFYDEMNDEIGYNDSFILVGHNIIGFDIPMIKCRSMVNGVYSDFIPDDIKPWSRDVFDTMTRWHPRRKISMTNLASAFGIESKTVSSGDKVNGLYKAGEYFKISEYCEEDVLVTREIYRRMTGSVTRWV